MDLEIISNLNKRVRMKDELYILGDFGESFKYLDCLNFKTLHFVKGNYERDKIPEIMKELKGKKDVIVYDNDECKVDIGGYKCTLRHEPISGNKLGKDEFALFGHIHSRCLIKGKNGDKTKGGLDVGIDAHNYRPVSEEDVSFFLNAIEKGFYDEQVFDNLE
jgi:calcineurin-like phosphoesterase family protein